MRGRPPKRVRSEAEIQELARRFAADWVEGDNVETWLNWHEGEKAELGELIVRGWTWSDVSRAMHAAGIHYRTGRPIPDETLRAKVYRIRRRNSPDAGPVRSARKAKPAVQRQSIGIPPLPSPESKPAFRPPAEVPSDLILSDADEDLNLVLRPVSLRNSGGPSPRKPPSPPPPNPPLNPPPKKPIDVDAVIARLLGKPLPPDDE